MQFSHANGFPASCYAAMTAELARSYRIGAIDAIGTDPRYPPTEGWPLLVEQLIAALIGIAVRRRKRISAPGSYSGISPSSVWRAMSSMR